MADLNENNVQANDVSNNVVSGVEPVRKHSAAKAAGIITASVLVVAAGGSAIAYNVSDFVKNQVKLRLSSPENYYAWVTEKNSSEIASQIASGYREALEERKNGQHSRLSLTYTMSDEFKNMVAEEIPEDENDLLNIVKGFNDITVGADAYQKAESMSGNVYTKINGDELIAFDTAVDLNAAELFFRIPALSEQWITASDIITVEYDELGEKVMSDPESIITPDELESLITKYSELYSSLLSDITIEKKEEVSVGDLTMNYTVAEFTIDKQKATEVAETFSSTMKEDELLRSIFVDRTGAMTDEEYDSELDSALEEIKDPKLTCNATVKTYIDANGDIRGIVIDNDSDEQDDFRFISGKENNKTYAELVAVENDKEVFRTDLTLNESDGVYDGDLNIISGGEAVKIEFKNASLAGDNKYINADAVIKYVDYDDEEQSISVSLKSDGSSQTVSSDIMIEDTNYGTITVEYSYENGAEPSIPDSSGAYDITADDADFPKDFVEQDKMIEFIENIYAKLGFDKQLAHDYALTMAESMYRSYDYMIDFDYPEINGWDIDDEDYYDFDDNDFDEDDFDLFWEYSDEDDDTGYDDDFDISDFDISFDRIGDDNMAVG